MGIKEKLTRCVCVCVFSSFIIFFNFFIFCFSVFIFVLRQLKDMCERVTLITQLQKGKWQLSLQVQFVRYFVLRIN